VRVRQEGGCVWVCVRARERKGDLKNVAKFNTDSRFRLQLV
jgi:hypothetical protein